MELDIPRDSYGPEFSQLTRHLNNKDGLLIGKASDNPILDTLVY